MTWVYSRWLLPDVHHPLELEQFQILSMVREIQMSKVNCYDLCQNREDSW